MMDKISLEISLACRYADTCLWEAYDRSGLDRFGTLGKRRLLFPTYRGKRGGSLRVSEQEARFAFVESLSRAPLLYSVEAPTDKLYQFTGKTPLSAQTDLTVHNEKGQRICNVEFKAKGVSLSAGKHFPIYKDLQKLLREQVWGLWFHLLQGVNNSTINNFLSVMAEQICKVQQEFLDDIESPGLTIHICVLQHGFSLQKDVIVHRNVKFILDELRKLLHLGFSVSRSKLLEIKNLNGWYLHRYEGPASDNTIEAYLKGSVV